MLSLRDFQVVMREKMLDAVSLYKNRRYSASIYLCGYAVEIALKIRICNHMGWTEFPETAGEFNKKEKYKFIKIHNLELLLAYTGLEGIIKDGSQPYKILWDEVVKWNPEERYSTVSAVTKVQAAIALSF